MPNFAIISDSSQSAALIQHAISTQTFKSSRFARSAADQISSDVDAIYFEVSRQSDIDDLELLQYRFYLTPIVAFLKSDETSLIVKAFRAGASDVVSLSGDVSRDFIEVVNSIYRAVRKRQSLVAMHQLSQNIYALAQLEEAHLSPEVSANRFIQQMEQAVVVLDKSLHIISLNSSAEKIIGEDESYLRGKRISLFLNIPETQLQYVLQGHSYRGEIFFRNDPHPVTLGYSLSARIDETGKPNGAILLFKDITREKQRRQEEEKAEKMQTLGEIAAAISHEVKNPLAGIKSMVQAILFDVPPDSETHQYIKRIGAEVDRINKFIEETFAFARHRKPKLVRVSVADVVQSVAQLLAQNFKNGQIELSVNIPPELPNIKADSDQIRQVILNIMLNAIEALTQQPNAKEKPKRLDVFAKQIIYFIDGEPTPFVELNFQDNGPGIPESILAKVFDPFFTTKPNGTGLGLAICFKIVSEHHGRIDISNVSEGGALVTIKLPAFAPPSNLTSSISNAALSSTT
ncbi:MAG: ATP-binding protein [Chloroherpetonaceae bacterium]|nr:ATP-binding protein [Chloroherpetonaceae bacterium]MDW8437152.1 ATP-binding protein [Chloroherpetonaceae bacterium]